MSAPTVDQEQELDRGRIELPDDVAPPHGDEGGSGGNQPPPLPPPWGRHTGYGRRKPPRWQRILVMIVGLLLSALCGAMIGRATTVMLAGLQVRAEGQS